MCTGAVYRDAAATQGMPDILWFKLTRLEWTEFVGEVRAGDELLLVLRYVCEESSAVAPVEDSDTLIAEWFGWTDTAKMHK